jgi:hypothetical protein
MAKQQDVLKDQDEQEKQRSNPNEEQETTID